MKPPSFEAILGALAVLAAGAGCSKAEKAAPVPATEEAQPASGAGAAATAMAPPAEPTPAATAPEPRPSEAAVDAGREVRSPGATKRNAPAAACGAAGCSPDMKK